MEKEKDKPKKKLTVFLILSTLGLCFGLIGAGIYSLYISIGFRFLSRNTYYGGLNTTSLFTYANSGFGTGTGQMIWLILVSIVMLGLGVGMAIIFFKQLPLYKQIKLIAKMPNVKYKDYSKQAKKSIIIISFVAYAICILFGVFAIVVALKSGISSNYLWLVIVSYALVIAQSIASLVLMILKLFQLSKIKKKLQDQDLTEQIKEQYQPTQPEKVVAISEKPNLQQKNADAIIESSVHEPSLFSDGVFQLADQLQKLREIHISGLISEQEYALLREKWINAVLKEPLIKNKKVKVKPKPQDNSLAELEPAKANITK